MARKPVPAKKKRTTATDATKETSITNIHNATCKNLSRSATITYHIGLCDTSAIHWRIHANSGKGMLSREWVPFTSIQAALKKWSKVHPIVSMALYSLYSGRSVNTPSFLLASLVNEGILQPVPDKLRHFQLSDPVTFLASVEKWKSQL